MENNIRRKKFSNYFISEMSEMDNNYKNETYRSSGIGVLGLIIFLMFFGVIAVIHIFPFLDSSPECAILMVAPFFLIPICFLIFIKKVY